MFLWSVLFASSSKHHSNWRERERESRAHVLRRFLSSQFFFSFVLLFCIYFDGISIWCVCACDWLLLRMYDFHHSTNTHTVRSPVGSQAGRQQQKNSKNLADTKMKRKQAEMQTKSMALKDTPKIPIKRWQNALCKRTKEFYNELYFCLVHTMRTNDVLRSDIDLREFTIHP